MGRNVFLTALDSGGFARTNAPLCSLSVSFFFFVLNQIINSEWTSSVSSTPYGISRRISLLRQSESVGMNPPSGDSNLAQTQKGMNLKRISFPCSRERISDDNYTFGESLRIKTKSKIINFGLIAVPRLLRPFVRSRKELKVFKWNSLLNEWYKANYELWE